MTADKPAIVDSRSKRIFHLTHRDNLPGILSSGRLLADLAGAKPELDLSSIDNRESRRTAKAGTDAVVAEFVPFFFAPNADVWDGMRSGSPDDRLGDKAQGVPVSDFVLLVSTVGAAGGTVVVADGDAADSSTKFTELARDDRMPKRFGEEAIELSGEFLVKSSFSFELVTLVGVANDKVRSYVRSVLRDSGFSPKVSVYPPWFQPPV